jgi:predicted transposase/invertase (TIGR01784 family)
MEITNQESGKNYIRFDWAIKRLLRNKADFGAINGLLSCLFEKQIYITSVLESEGNQEDENDKFNRVDLLVEDENREKIIIEIQNNYQVDYYHRMLYGVSKLVCDYLKKGDKYDKIEKIYSISIVYFELGHGNDYVYFGNTEFRGKHTNDILELTRTQKERYQKEKVGDVFPDYCVLRVENFDEVAKTPLDEWIYYLKTTKIPDSFTAQGLDEIRTKQKIEDLPETERKAYYHHLDRVGYEEGVIEHQRSEARIEGEKIGMEKGKAEEKLEIAQKLKITGMPCEQINEITGLTKDEIENLELWK